MLVRSLKTDDTLYSVNASKLMMPASNMKIVTLAAAAEKLGWDYRYETQLVATGSIVSGTLDGDLVVVGSGDPTLMITEATPRPFDAWAAEVKRRGISRVTGRDHRRRNGIRESGIRFRLVVGRPARFGRCGR